MFICFVLSIVKLLIDIIPKREFDSAKDPPRNLLSERATASAEALLAVIEGEKGEADG
jgi:hypothetical protein